MKRTKSGFSEGKARYRAGTAAPQPQPPRLPPPEALSDGTVRYFLRVGPKGRVLLPADLRAAMGLKEGDLFVAWLKDGTLRLESHGAVLNKIQEQGRRLAQGRSVVDELIAERRAAAASGD